MAVSDGLWMITLGQRGLIGLVALPMMILLPAVLVFRRFPARKWSVAALVPAVALSGVLVLYMIDNLLNAMVDPILRAVSGALAGLAVTSNPLVNLRGFRISRAHSAYARADAVVQGINR